MDEAAIRKRCEEIRARWALSSSCETFEDALYRAAYADGQQAAKQEYHERFATDAPGWRGVEPHDVCLECGGSGTKSYANTSTFHYGAGGQSITLSVCDKCWGSGNRYRPWPSWKARRAEAYADGQRAGMERAAKNCERHGCHCAHSQLGGSQEWDRKHEAHCPISLAFQVRQAVGGGEVMGKTYIFECDAPGDMSVGISPYRDTITVTVDSGDPGGTDGEFAEHIQHALLEWIDGGSVKLIEPGEVK